MEQLEKQNTIEVPKSNPLGKAGFAFALLGLLICWMPAFPFWIFLGVYGLSRFLWFVFVISWLLGLIFSCIGVAKKPRKRAIAGLIMTGASIFITIITIMLRPLIYELFYF